MSLPRDVAKRAPKEQEPTYEELAEAVRAARLAMYGCRCEDREIIDAFHKCQDLVNRMPR